MKGRSRLLCLNTLSSFSLAVLRWLQSRQEPCQFPFFRIQDI